MSVGPMENMMPFCPTCRQEFIAEIKFCKNCDVELVDQLEPIGTEDLEILCTVYQEENAYIIRGFLENEGIPCQLENIVFHAEPIPVAGLTRVRLWTKKTDVEQAKNLMEEHERFNVCSSCGHVVLKDDLACDFCGESFEES